MKKATKIFLLIAYISVYLVFDFIRQGGIFIYLKNWDLLFKSFNLVIQLFNQFNDICYEIF